MLPTFEINIPKAIYWIKQAWNDIKCDTIAKCLKKCGFPDNTAKINWEANACDIIEALEEKEKAESEEEKGDATNDYSMDPLISSFPTALNHVTYLKQF